MNILKSSIYDLFNGQKAFRIPVYQRAYSWDRVNLSQFLDDIKEASQGKNEYFFGNVLIENNSDIIDGQQRITTILIFIRALLDILPQNMSEENNFRKDFILEDFLIYRNVPKLTVIEYDRDYFKSLIINGDDDKSNPSTPSQVRIKEAKEYFKTELKKLELETIKSMYYTVCKAQIITIPFENKKDSVLMFELQNNRGKSLTNMEKLKSFISYQIYIHAQNKQQVELKLSEVIGMFEDIYRELKNINANEDSVLRYFNISKFGFTYREDDPKLNYKKHLKEQCFESHEVIKWIDDYVKNLKNAFLDFKEFEKTEYIKQFRALERWEVYPFVIKAYSMLRQNSQELVQVFKALEIIAFRDRAADTRADLASRLNSALDFSNSAELVDKLRKICNGDMTIQYWGDERISANLTNINDIKLLNYIFVKYENFLRQKHSTKRGYVFENNVKDPQIEHISPQTEPNEKLASGYSEYDQIFFEKYINSIGNKVLIAGSHNASIGNKPFLDKLSSYNEADLMQLKEVCSFATDNKIWDKKAIEKRQISLVNFIQETWRY
ncbi:DUF262 domain-containing protein [Campylobacter sp. RM16190]|uniref:DUF262 domain-containing protein n=1 Tax=Campylobacter sp. RM16190 TaxID=1705727 RepID=UPI0014749AB0|nr:DUF262 domain-containing protein [Campylobacter sp. RM16190]